MHVYMDDVRPSYPSWVEGWQDWVTVRSVANVKTLLLAGLVEDMSLDYDMNEDLTGYDLVEWIVENDAWPKGVIAVHSTHPTGAKQMRETIERCRPKC